MASTGACLAVTQASTRQEIIPLTSLRYFAALGVVVYHFGPAAGLAVPGSLGPLMVTLFFVLSGFVLAVAYLGPARFPVARFLANRLSRIAPIYFVALALMLAIRHYSGREFDARALVLHLGFLQSWHADYALSINPPAWSISVEVFFYLLFPLLATRLMSRQPGVGRVVGWALLFWLLTQCALLTLFDASSMSDVSSHHLVYYFPPAHLCSFILGVSAGYAFIRIPEAQWREQSTTSVTLGLAAMVIVSILWAGQLVGPECVPVTANSSLLAPLFACFVLALATARTPVVSMLSWPPFVKLGEASYSLYILQIPLFELLKPAIGFNDGRIAPQGLLVFMVVLSAFSIVTFLIIERPFMRLSRRLYVFLANRPMIATAQ